MGLYDKLMGKATLGAETKYVEDFLIPGENVIVSYKFIRDSIVLTNLGIYMIDVQGFTGKKIEIKFFPGKTIKSVSFETAGNFDLDVDIKISVDGNKELIGQTYVSKPLSFKVPSSQSKAAKEIIGIIKQNYLC